MINLELMLIEQRKQKSLLVVKLSSLRLIFQFEILIGGNFI